MKLYSPAAVRQIIEKYKFRFQKGLGQNFLIDRNIIDKIVEAAGVTNEDTVLEIGAGIGALTCALAAKAAKVVVIEIDKNLLPILEETLAGCNNVEISWGNALKINFDQLIFEKTKGMNYLEGKTYKIVANLPYYITTPLIIHALEKHVNIDSMVFMMQKEVAERITASPGRKDYGVLTISVNYYSEPQLLMRVPNTVFIPQPEVESAVIRLKPREKPPATVEDKETFFRVVRAAFGQRRKTLANTLSEAAKGLSKSRITQLLSDLGVDSNRRGETLSFKEFADISNAVWTEKKSTNSK